MAVERILALAEIRGNVAFARPGGRRGGSARRASSTAARSRAPPAGRRARRSSVRGHSAGQLRSGACMEAPMSDSGPPTAGWLSKSNSRLSMFAICVRRLPSASRRITWAFIWPMRMATASTRRCSSAFSSLISDCCSARVCGPGGDTARRAAALADLESEAESGRQDGDEHGRETGDGQGMTEVEVPGTSFAAREENDVHRASSGRPPRYRWPWRMSCGVASIFKELAHGWHPRRPLHRDISERNRQGPAGAKLCPKDPTETSKRSARGPPRGRSAT